MWIIHCLTWKSNLNQSNHVFNRSRRYIIRISLFYSNYDHTWLRELFQSYFYLITGLVLQIVCSSLPLPSERLFFSYVRHTYAHFLQRYRQRSTQNLLNLNPMFVITTSYLIYILLLLFHCYASSPLSDAYTILLSYTVSMFVLIKIITI